MKVVVTDANIFFDLFGIGALEAFFDLRFEVHTTTLVLDECDQPERQALQVHIDQGRLRVRAFSEDEIGVVENTGRRRGLRLPDRSILVHARQLAGMVLTGDGDMRKESKEMGLECHGILWCIRQVRGTFGLDDPQCLTLLDELERINKWLPEKELEKLRTELGG